MSTVIEIIREYLKQNGYDGLAGDDCGCEVDDLQPCCSDCGSCEPGYKVPCSDCPADGDCEWHMSTEKPAALKENGASGE